MRPEVSSLFYATVSNRALHLGYCPSVNPVSRTDSTAKSSGLKRLSAWPFRRGLQGSDQAVTTSLGDEQSFVSRWDLRAAKRG